MGSGFSRRKSNAYEKNGTITTTTTPSHVMENLRLLEEEMREMRSKREKESRAHKRLAREVAAKQEEWKRERKRWKDEVRRLRKRLEEKEEIVSSHLEEDVLVGVVVKGEREWEMERNKLLVEHMREEQARREEAVEKWKRLYLAIKIELDHLIHRTRQGERLWWGAEEDGVIKGLQRELKTKEETVEALRAQISAMEDMGAKREREVDILRQSLRIMSNSKRDHVANNLSKPA